MNKQINNILMIGDPREAAKSAIAGELGGFFEENWISEIVD